MIIDREGFLNAYTGERLNMILPSELEVSFHLDNFKPLTSLSARLGKYLVKAMEAWSKKLS